MKNKLVIIVAAIVIATTILVDTLADIIKKQLK